MKRKIIFWAVLTVFAGMLFFLTFNRHSRTGYFNYHSEIWSDKAGYYMYLPAVFKYGFDPQLFPDSIDHQTGDGFYLNLQNNTIQTKYTYGVALFELPFYLMADLLADLLHQQSDGFTPVYHWFINIAAVFWLLVGLYFLGTYLKGTYQNSLVYLVLLFALFSTNLYYYSIDETGMSHVYSFALFSMFLFMLKQTRFLEKVSISKAALFGLLSALIVLVRPTNIVFLSCFLFLDANSFADIILRIKRLFQPRILISIVLMTILVFIPQMIYWHYTFGSLICYSYRTEGFNWLHPMPFHTWFSTNNGLFLYTPFYAVIIAAIIYMILKRQANGWFILCLFITITYVFSAWWDWHFGCAFGARCYVEYMAVFCIPMAALFQKINSSRKIVLISFWILVLALTVFNLKLTYVFDGCFYGTNWDWHTYMNLLGSMLN